jgi:hypothetical protein
MDGGEHLRAGRQILRTPLLDRGHAVLIRRPHLARRPRLVCRPCLVRAARLVRLARLIRLVCRPRLVRLARLIRLVRRPDRVCPTRLVRPAHLARAAHLIRAAHLVRPARLVCLVHLIRLVHLIDLIHQGIEPRGPPDIVPDVDHLSSPVALFARSWAALRAAVAGLAPEDHAASSGCAGWLVRDLVCHLVIDAQDVLITLATPADTAPTADAASYWHPQPDPPTGDDPLAALTVRLAAAYQDPALLAFHLDDVGSAAGRAALLADPDALVGTQDMVLTVRDYLHAYVLEWTLHHLDLTARLPHVPGPAPESLRAARQLLEQAARVRFPAALDDRAALLVGTGRRAPTPAEADAPGPFSLG